MRQNIPPTPLNRKVILLYLKKPTQKRATILKKRKDRSPFFIKHLYLKIFYFLCALAGLAAF